MGSWCDVDLSWLFIGGRDSVGLSSSSFPPFVTFYQGEDTIVWGFSCRDGLSAS
jgi:hypothetical protein